MKAATALEGRYEKSALLLLALKRGLKERSPLDGAEQEFLSLVASLEEADTRAFTNVWRDPYCYWWSRLAYSLLGACNQELEPGEFERDYIAALGLNSTREALAHHLQQFKRVALGLALSTGGSLQLPSTLEVKQPLALPGTRLVVPGPLSVAGVRSGRLIDAGGRQAALRTSPVCSAGGLAWRLQPEAWLLEGLGVEMPSEALAEGYQESVVPLVNQSLSLIAHYLPGLQEGFAAIPRVVAFKPLDSGSYTNVTHSELPGAFVCSVYRQPYDLADTMIHEFHHNLLYAEEEDAAFLDEDYEDTPSFYSPFRPDSRDLHGVLHAVYVFLAASRFWVALREAGDDAPVHDYTLDRLVRYPLQIRLGIEVLRENARFSERGRKLFDAICADLDDLQAEIDRLAIGSDVPSVVCEEDGSFRSQEDDSGRALTAREAVAYHVEKYDRDGSGARARALVGL